MNIFVTDPDAVVSAQCLPGRHVVKMPLETCQMLSIVASASWGHGYGHLPKKKTGTWYATAKGAFRNHPCTIWAQSNFRWLIKHGLALCEEYTHRYDKIHSCQLTLEYADIIFPAIECPTPFTRAMPDEFKYDTSIDTFTAYKTYIASKPWASSNYLRDPSRKPDWL